MSQVTGVKGRDSAGRCLWDRALYALAAFTESLTSLEQGFIERGYTMGERIEMAMRARAHKEYRIMFGGMHNGFFGGMGGFGLLGALIALFFIIGIVLAVAAVVVWLVRNSSSSRTAPKAGTRPALEVLQERYARGELSREEFLRMREDLT